MAAIAAGLIGVGTVLVTVGGGLAGIGLAIGGIAALLPILAAIGPPLAIALGVAVLLAAAVAGIGFAMRQLGVSLTTVIGWLKNLSPLLLILERFSPALRGMAAAAAFATTALVAQAQAVVNAATSWRDYGDAVDEANDALDVHAQILKSIETAMARRNRLVSEFATAEERAAAKEKEIVGALNEVNRNRVLGFLTEGEAAAETRALQIALARHRLHEAERRKQPAGVKLPAAAAGIPLPPGTTAADRPSTTAQSAAAAIALTHGGAGGQVGWRDVVNELRETRRDSVRRHEEALREMRRNGVKFGP